MADGKKKKPSENGASEKESMKWMYEKETAIIDREKYLLGQKVDKNFELYQNATRKSKATALDAILEKRAGAKASGFQSEVDIQHEKERSLLRLETVRKEDPLVKIRVSEAKLQEELVNNPVRVMRLQKLLKEAMEKKMRKMMKKAAKAERKAAKKAAKGKREASSESESDRETKDDRHRRRSPAEPKPSVSSRHSPPHRTGHDRSRSPPSMKLEPKSKRRASDSEDSDAERKRSKFAGYGLVKVKKEEDEDVKPATNSSRSEVVPTKGIPMQMPWARPAPLNDMEKSGSSGRYRRTQQLDADERERRLAEMQSNAKWRDEQRVSTLKRAELLEAETEAKDKEDKRKRGVDFMKPMLSDAQDRDSLGNRIQRQRGQLQRGADAMNQHFARR